MFLTPKRSQHFAAMILIGDGVMALIHPSNDAQAWKKGPKPWRNLMHYLSEKPNLTRAIGATQILAGVLWALHQSKVEPHP
jgi:uncharacterized protein YjeT (DUF2065 family)